MPLYIERQTRTDSSEGRTARGRPETRRAAEAALLRIDLVRAAARAPAPRVLASGTWRKARRTVCPANGVRSNVSVFQPPLSPFRPGQLFLRVLCAPGSRSQVVSALARL